MVLVHFFKAIYDGDFISTIKNAESTGVFNVMVSFGLESYVLFGLGLLFIVLTIFAATKKKSVFATTFASFLMIVSVYFGIMMSVQ